MYIDIRAFHYGTVYLKFLNCVPSLFENETTINVVTCYKLICNFLYKNLVRIAGCSFLDPNRNKKQNISVAFRYIFLYTLPKYYSNNV